MPRFVDTQASVLLDLLRGLAALLVLGEHWRNLLFVDYSQTTAHKKILLLPYLVTGAGHQAVIVFFVLSGYLIGGSISRAVKLGTWSWGSYLTHRLVRLWLVLVPGLLLGLVCDVLGIWFGRAPLLYGGIKVNHMIHAVRPALSVKVFVGNIFFLQGWDVPLFGSNVALWSLPLEFWYYVIFPLGLFVVLWRYSVVTRCTYVVCVAALLWILGYGVIRYLPVWLLGVVLVVIPAPRVGGRWRLAACLLYIPLVLFFGENRKFPVLYADYTLGVATFLMVWVLLSAGTRAEPSAVWVRWSRSLSRFSFTLYMVHTPFLVLLTSLGPRNARWVPSPLHVGLAFAMLAGTLLYSYAVAWATEFRTDRVRRWVELRLGLVKHDSPSPHSLVLKS